MSSTTTQLQTTQLFGWPILAVPKATWWSELAAKLNQSDKELITIFTPNPEIVVQAQANRAFHQIITQADYLIPDGVGLIWAAKRLKTNHQIPERIAGVDVVTDLLKFSAEKNWQVLIIGGRDYQASLSKLPGKVAWVSGFNDVRRPTETETEQILSELHRLKPQLVFVALGAPHQETWITAHQQVLSSAGVRLVMGVGGAFDYLLAKVPRAPIWLRKLGFEWLFRLIIQPWRIWRQLSILKFLWLVETRR